MTLLAIDKLSVAYGDLFAVREVSFEVKEGSVFVLLGANGAGKTSILRTISGLIVARGGAINAEAKSLLGLTPHQVARLGISHVPEGRRVFPNLTVEENLVVSFLPDRAKVSIADAFAAVYSLFPRLAERRSQAGGTLSGGEQQMLAIARAMMLEPKIILLDEPTEGLMPRMVSQIQQIIGALHNEGVAILLVEQNVPLTLEASQRVYIMEKGTIRHQAASSELKIDDPVIKQYLGV